MSLHDEFEAVKHAPHELVAWVKALLVKLEGEPEVVAESAPPLMQIRCPMRLP